MDRSLKPSDRFDWTLSFLLLLFAIVSCTAIYSAQTLQQYDKNFLLMQIFWYGVGAFIAGVTMYFDSEQFRKLSWILYAFGILLLVALALAPSSIAPVIKGAKSWFVIPHVGSIQPSEFVKVFLIMALSKLIASHHEKFIRKTLKTDFYLLIKLGAVTALPLGLILVQDLGTALVIIAIMLGIIFVSGISWKILLPIYSAGIGFAASVLYLVIWAPDVIEKYLKVDPYQFDRIYSWLDPESYGQSAGLQLLRSLQAIGSGLITGKGVGDRQVNIPDNHSDFIFSVIGEEYGFLGASIVISLFFLLIYHLTKTAMETKDPYNTYICTGIISMITFHVFQNIGMTIQLLPITGIPLPFISYGGSSLMGNMFAMGLIFSIRFHHKTYMFSSDSQ
ncbi:FtsW/RodA/SpoVE family cell cycle protein [Bacillus infantis]|uniref:Rod shape-determining protein RodA n=1 Tax=Bacillus infantis TaxID=324767 RepID=A0A5D4QYG8_9BACI|nr:FtsW/RodA/SpoVE family cell cycle protein [Bacillus infantis]TYS42941.1 rod shape-determining protein RodA [Bacillus infantis]